MNNSDDLTARIRELFKNVPPIAEGDKVATMLGRMGLNRSYVALAMPSDMPSMRAFTPHRFMPEEFMPLLEDLAVSSLSVEELMKNQAKRATAREEFAIKSRRDPEWFIAAMKKMLKYQYDPTHDPKTGSAVLSEEDRLHSELTAHLAFYTMSELWREVSLKLVGRGSYLIGFKHGKEPVSKRIGEPPANLAALREAVIKWWGLGAHTLTFLDMGSLDRLVPDNAVWSGTDVIKGYPWIANAAEEAYRLISHGYSAKEPRYSPLLHLFPLSGPNKKPYKAGQSIASVAVVDLDSPLKGFEYLIRHTDNTIAVGRIYSSPELGQFTITHSNHIGYINHLGPNAVADPIFGLGIMVSAMARDMRVYDRIDGAYRVKHGKQNPAEHQNPEPVEIWLPQRLYHYNTDPTESRDEHESVSERVRKITPHPVSRHKMKLQPGHNPSPRQLALAAEVGYQVPPDHTFVREHWVGREDPNMTKFYRSKSATAILLQAK